MTLSYEHTRCAAHDCDTWVDPDDGYLDVDLDGTYCSEHGGLMVAVALCDGFRERVAMLEYDAL